MMKLGSEAAKMAFEEFKQYLKDVALITEEQNINLAKMAFLHGFASGELHKEEAAPGVSNYHEAPKDLVKTFVNKVNPVDKIPYAEFKKGADVSKLDPAVAEKLQTKTGIKRTKIRPSKMRTPKERQVHARLVASILQSAGKPLKLNEITKLVNDAGANWYDKSASGHMLDAMEFQPCIKKVGYGTYEYQQ